MHLGFENRLRSRDNAEDEEEKWQFKKSSEVSENRKNVENVLIKYE